MLRTIAAMAGLLTLSAGPASAQVTSFVLTGTGGSGLLGSNENPAVTGGGSGGLLAGGITYNAANNVLGINAGWGSGRGFVDLTGNATMGHLHGPTTSAAPGSFTQNANIKYDLAVLTGWNPSASSGGFIGTVTILEADEPALLNGQFYMNIHTVANSGGEIRGYLVPVPEPGLMLGTTAAGLFGVGVLRRRHPPRA
jgi:CHRD domain